MSTCWRYSLELTSPLHLASGGLNYEVADTFLHSDTLYSAVCSVAARLFPPAEFAAYFLDPTQPRIQVSSTFPYQQDGFWLPRPLAYHPAKFLDWPYDAQKNWKKQAFLPWDTVLTIAAGGEVDRPVHPTPAAIIREMPRVTLDRWSNASTLFFYADVVFGPDSGLYFLATFSDPSAQQAFELALRVLGDTGFGGDRGVGKGLFSLSSTAQVALPEDEASSSYLLLSLYTPQEQEVTLLNSSSSYYQLGVRQGWVSEKGLRRRTIRTFMEGSVLTFQEPHQPQGLLAPSLDARYLGYPVYRNLRAFSIPFKHRDHD